jgi:hypothetical protein
MTVVQEKINNSANSQLPFCRQRAASEENLWPWGCGEYFVPWIGGGCDGSSTNSIDFRESLYEICLEPHV